MTITERIEQMKAAGVFPVKLDFEPATDVHMERGMVVVQSRVDSARFSQRIAEIVLDEKAGNFKTHELRRFATV